jgi:hypothetical protein
VVIVFHARGHERHTPQYLYCTKFMAMIQHHLHSALPYTGKDRGRLKLKAYVYAQKESEAAS